MLNIAIYLGSINNCRTHVSIIRLKRMDGHYVANKDGEFRNENKQKNFVWNLASPIPEMWTW